MSNGGRAAFRRFVERLEENLFWFEEADRVWPVKRMDTRTEQRVARVFHDLGLIWGAICEPDESLPNRVKARKRRRQHAGG